MSVDLRRFSYPLAALLQRRQWQLDTLNARLGRLQHSVAACQRELADWRLQHAQGSRDAADAAQRQLDPARHARDLLWLRQLKGHIEATLSTLAELQAQRATALQACLAQQQQCDAIAAHRRDALDEFAREEGGRVAAEADKDWLTRQPVGGRPVAARQGDRPWP